MVLPGRIELPTFPLPRGCSTTELRQLGHGRREGHGNTRRIHSWQGRPGLVFARAESEARAGAREACARTLPLAFVSRSMRRQGGENAAFEGAGLFLYRASRPRRMQLVLQIRAARTRTGAAAGRRAATGGAAGGLYRP